MKWQQYHLHESQSTETKKIINVLKKITFIKYIFALHILKNLFVIETYTLREIGMMIVLKSSLALHLKLKTHIDTFTITQKHS